MSYEIAPMVLYCQDRNRMLNFLSDVFEFEVDESEFLVSSQGLCFRLEYFSDVSKINHEDNFSSIVFNFRLKSESQIEEILNKYKFFLYRRSDSLNVEKCDLIESENNKILRIIDTDQRSWCFEYRKAI